MNKELNTQKCEQKDNSVINTYTDYGYKYDMDSNNGVHTIIEHKFEMNIISFIINFEREIYDDDNKTCGIIAKILNNRGTLYRGHRWSCLDVQCIRYGYEYNVHGNNEEDINKSFIINFKRLIYETDERTCSRITKIINKKSLLRGGITVSLAEVKEIRDKQLNNNRTYI